MTMFKVLTNGTITFEDVATLFPARGGGGGKQYVFELMRDTSG